MKNSQPPTTKHPKLEDWQKDFLFPYAVDMATELLQRFNFERRLAKDSNLRQAVLIQRCGFICSIPEGLDKKTLEAFFYPVEFGKAYFRQNPFGFGLTNATENSAMKDLPPPLNTRFPCRIDSKNYTTEVVDRINALVSLASSNRDAYKACRLLIYRLFTHAKTGKYSCVRSRLTVSATDLMNFAGRLIAGEVKEPLEDKRGISPENFTEEQRRVVVLTAYIIRDTFRIPYSKNTAKEEEAKTSISVVTEALKRLGHCKNTFPSQLEQRIKKERAKINQQGFDLRQAVLEVEPLPHAF